MAKYIIGTHQPKNVVSKVEVLNSNSTKVLSLQEVISDIKSGTDYYTAVKNNSRYVKGTKIILTDTEDNIITIPEHNSEHTLDSLPRF